ncbi:hypothetical protein B0H11DRAFT_2251658 [Mycena galericulata]|nr:hypothetical protein B0H11DRAFT_2251658 [Mycena galericulata]
MSNLSRLLCVPESEISAGTSESTSWCALKKFDLLSRVPANNRFANFVLDTYEPVGGQGTTLNFNHNVPITPAPRRHFPQAKKRSVGESAYSVTTVCTRCGRQNVLLPSENLSPTRYRSFSLPYRPYSRLVAPFDLRTSSSWSQYYRKATAFDPNTRMHTVAPDPRLCPHLHISIDTEEIDSSHFIDPAAAFTFFQVSSYQGLALNNRRLKVGWSKNSWPRRADSGARSPHREERLKAEFGDVEVINFLKEKNCATAHGKDRCANSLRSGPQGGAVCAALRAGTGPNSAEPVSAVEPEGEMDFDVKAVQAEAEGADAVDVKQEQQEEGMTVEGGVAASSLASTHPDWNILHNERLKHPHTHLRLVTAATNELCGGEGEENEKSPAHGRHNKTNRPCLLFCFCVGPTLFVFLYFPRPSARRPLHAHHQRVRSTVFGLFIPFILLWFSVDTKVLAPLLRPECTSSSPHSVKSCGASSSSACEGGNGRTLHFIPGCAPAGLQHRLGARLRVLQLSKAVLLKTMLKGSQDFDLSPL